MDKSEDTTPEWLSDIDACGCVEIWETLSEERSNPSEATE